MTTPTSYIIYYLIVPNDLHGQNYIVFVKDSFFNIIIFFFFAEKNTWLTNSTELENCPDKLDK